MSIKNYLPINTKENVLPCPFCGGEAMSEENISTNKQLETFGELSIAALVEENELLKQLLIEAILLPNTMIPTGAHEFITDAELAEAYKHKPQMINQIEKMLDDVVRENIEKYEQ